MQLIDQTFDVAFFGIRGQRNHGAFPRLKDQVGDSNGMLDVLSIA